MRCVPCCHCVSLGGPLWWEDPRLRRETRVCPHLQSSPHTLPHQQPLSCSHHTDSCRNPPPPASVVHTSWGWRAVAPGAGAPVRRGSPSRWEGRCSQIIPVVSLQKDWVSLLVAFYLGSERHKIHARGLWNIRSLRLTFSSIFLLELTPQFLISFEVFPFRCLHGPVHSASVKLKLSRTDSLRFETYFSRSPAVWS